MAKFEYKITKILNGGKIWTHFIIVRAADKLEALATIEQMFPPKEHEYQFIGTC